MSRWKALPAVDIHATHRTVALAPASSKLPTTAPSQLCVDLAAIGVDSSPGCRHPCGRAHLLRCLLGWFRIQLLKRSPLSVVTPNTSTYDSSH